MPYKELLAYFGNDKQKLRLYNSHIKNKYLKVGKVIPKGVIANLPKEDKTQIAGVVDRAE